MPDLPRFELWPETGPLSASEVQEYYERGYAGVVPDPGADYELLFNTRYAKGSTASRANGWEGSGAGKLIVPFVVLEKFFPGSLPGPAQERGDCVSHSEKNACLLTMVCDIFDRQPDEVTGKIEGAPDVSTRGVRNGVLSTEWIYWFRGYDGDGWDCSSAANVVRKYGIMLRQKYKSLGIDLTEYSGRLAGKYGRTAPPENMQAEGRLHLVRDNTWLSTFEEVRDFLANGYGLSSCGGEGFSSVRDANGVATRKGSWSHAMAYIGADDRDVIKERYKEPLVLVQNSWGTSNSGPRTILGTDIDIPHGSFWARWSDVRRRTCYAHSGVDGWPAKELDFLAAWKSWK